MRGRLLSLVQWGAHHHLAVWAGGALAAGTLVLGYSFPAIPTGATAVGAVLSISAGLEALHTRHLCPRCAAAIPLNPGAYARRHDLALHLHHLLHTPALRLPTGLTVLLTSTAVLHDPHPQRWFLLLSLETAGLHTALLSCRRHHTRVLHCPYCRRRGRGGGGGGTTTPTPDPVTPEYALR